MIFWKILKTQVYKMLTITKLRWLTMTHLLEDIDYSKKLLPINLYKKSNDNTSRGQIHF